jgi:hypothetical protein
VALTCSVCLHPDHETADAQLRVKASYRSVAKRYGLSRDAVRRHVISGHVPPEPVEESTTTPDPTGPYNPIDALRADLALVNGMDPATMSATAAMALFAERRRLNVELARLDPPVVSPPETPTVAKFLEVVTAAVEEHPEIGRRIVSAWREYKGMAPTPERDDEAEAKWRTS